MASASDLILLQQLLREVQQDPTREEVIITEHRAFFRRLVLEVQHSGNPLPDRFNSIIRRYGLGG